MLRVILILAVVAAPAVARAESPRFGAMMDVGVPSAAGASMVFRPVRALRLHVGGGHNLVAPGVQGGISLIPLDSWVSPALVLEAGRFFPGDANAAVERVSGEPSSAVAPERFGYDYASAHVGLELGREWVTFYVHGGVSHVRADWTGEDTTEDGSVTTMTDIELRATGVSARLGFIFYIAN